jgi:uncharacterized SAM-binding protein YcdF (DUF218 family)
MLPPGGIILIILGVGVVVLRRELRKSNAHLLVAIAILTTGLLFYLLSIRPVADMLISPLEKRASFNTTNAVTVSDTLKPESIVVLGGGTLQPRWQEDQILAHASTARTVTGFILHRHTGLPLVITGGTPLNRNRDSEASTASKLLASLGASPESLFVETESNNTWENAAFLEPILEAKTIYLVTSAFHMRRSIECFQAFGFHLIPVPTDFRAWARPYVFWDFLPNTSSLDDSAAALHEFIGRVFYRIRYGPGGYRFR